jgi:hypothetical protein
MNATMKAPDGGRDGGRDGEKRTAGKTVPAKTPTDEMIADVAYAKWERAGKPHDQFDRFWREASDELERYLSGD